MMKEMGCDAIRTAHNMPSTLQMEVCDSMGMMVMAESFDMWIYPKCKNGYARFFKEWSDRDIENLVLNHRNHPSIVMWSIGNEIPEQWSEEGREISRHLQDICHRLDPSRPVTQGMDRAEAALKSGFAQVMDVPGFNYRVQKYENNIKQLPQGFLLGSETASTVSSRGVYKFPVEVSNHAVYPDGQCSSYDTEYCSWSNLPDDDWRMQDDYPWVIGEFVWTGYDYLGEPTPYDEYWPSRSSYFGICDLAGLPKDRSQQVEQRVAHVAPAAPLDLAWPRGQGDTRVLLYRQPFGRVVCQWQEPGPLVQRPLIPPRPLSPALERCDLRAWRTSRGGLRRPRQGSFVTVSLVDDAGTLLPDASNQLVFEVEGAGRFKAACNGDATSLEPFTTPTMRLFHGQLVVVVQSSHEKGALTLRVRDAKGALPPAEATIMVE